MVEVLSPAGNLEKLKWALMYGADAVYIGGEDYSLRANAGNFTINEIKEAVSFAHNLGKKVYITTNIIFHNEDIKNLDDYLITLSDIGVDAYIVSDLAVIKRINELKLKPEIHISTQESTINRGSAEFFKNLGASRVVLGREASREDIIDIKENVDIELEVFVHGAMCISYSGRCVLSNYVTKRDANRGGCAQVCRFNFNVPSENISDYQICSKDLCMIDYVSDLIDIGVNSLKIEGRMRSLYYIATVVNSYKNIVNKKLNNNLTKEDIEYYKKVLNRLSNRENTAIFYASKPGASEQYYTGRKEESNQDFLGIVLEYNNGYAKVEERNNFKIDSEIEVFSPINSARKFKVSEIINENGEKVMSAKHPQEILKIKVPFEVQKNDILRVPIY